MLLLTLSPSRTGADHKDTEVDDDTCAASDLSVEVGLHVSLVPVFTVPDGRMDEFVANFAEFYDKTRAGTEECLYYGFAISGNQVLCREGYTSAAGVLQHLEDVKAPLDVAVNIVGE